MKKQFRIVENEISRNVCRCYQSHTGNRDTYYECHTDSDGTYKQLVFLTYSASHTNIKLNMSQWLNLYLPDIFRNNFGHKQNELLQVAESI